MLLGSAEGFKVSPLRAHVEVDEDDEEEVEVVEV